ncbi:neuropilin and tolloid-like protein 2 [Culicoides brevitarsis]|uniref:neuropilin and tolloid-like protein 2 n=1 Tax=Culicoides brevitarsis TaxID=469753 RepID=UPI00307C28E9
MNYYKRKRFSVVAQSLVLFFFLINTEVFGISHPEQVLQNSKEHDKSLEKNSVTSKDSLILFKENQSKFQRSTVNMYTSAATCESFTFDDPAGHILHSPGFPNNYPNSVDCVRILEAPIGFVLRLDFRDSFFIEPSDDCKFDFLEIRDGAHGFSTLIGQYCGNNFPPMIQSKDRFLWLHFHSDDNIEYHGFTAVYEFIPRPTATVFDEEGCRMNRDGNEGFINRTDIPHTRVRTVVEHGLSLDCMWTITVQEGWKVQLSFEKFKLEKPNDCESNFIDVFDERTDMPSRLRNFCGSVADSVNSKTNVVHIRFFAEASAVNSSFAILYTAYHDKIGSSAKCEDDEFDCEDAKCISSDLYCNGITNCQYRWDEMKCSQTVVGQSEHITIIIVVFGLILGGMMVTFIINCIRKLAKDQKIIREHIRQSRESELDAIDHREIKKSLQSIDKINGKSSLKSVDFHELGTYQMQVSSSQSASKDSEERHYNEALKQNNEININHQEFLCKPSNKMCEVGSQTRESLFQNICNSKAQTSHRLSSFGVPTIPSFQTAANDVEDIGYNHKNHWGSTRTQRFLFNNNKDIDIPDDEHDRKSAPDVIIVTNSISTKP